MKKLNATLIGATGLIGSNLLEILQKQMVFEWIIVLSRRPIYFDNEKTIVKVIDFADEKQFAEGIAGADVVFCAVGTTLKNVKGNKVSYREIDYKIPENAARLCKELGCECFVLVSAVGATSSSRNFYVKLKGEAEEAVASKGLRSVSIFRPSLLLGKRREFRFAERLAGVLMPVFSVLLPSKYKPVKARDVAKAMAVAAMENFEGSRVYHLKEIISLAGKLEGTSKN